MKHCVSIRHVIICYNALTSNPALSQDKAISPWEEVENGREKDL